jgi:hypothetical protein
VEISMYLCCGDYSENDTIVSKYRVAIGCIKHRWISLIHPSTVITYRVEISVIPGCDDSIAFIRKSGSPIPKEEFVTEVNGLSLFWERLHPFGRTCTLWGKSAPILT